MLHSSNLEEARATQVLAQYTAVLAEQTSSDTTSMITIAAVTMLFLPATFVSVRPPHEF